MLRGQAAKELAPISLNSVESCLSQSSKSVLMSKPPRLSGNSNEVLAKKVPPAVSV